MMPSTRLKKIVGVIIGSVTWRRRAQLPAPSTLAASYSSSDTPCSPARKMTIRVPPTLAQSAREISAGIVQEGSWNQRGRTMPVARKTRRLTGPQSAWSSQNHRTVEATIGTSDGMKKKVR